MKLRIVPLLANKLTAPAALGLPLLLRCGAAAASLPVPLAIATVWIWGHFLRLKNMLILGCIPSPRLLMSSHRPPSPFAADVWGMRESRAGRRERR